MNHKTFFYINFDLNSVSCFLASPKSKFLRLTDEDRKKYEKKKSLLRSRYLCVMLFQLLKNVELCGVNESVLDRISKHSKKKKERC